MSAGLSFVTTLDVRIGTCFGKRVRGNEIVAQPETASWRRLMVGAGQRAEAAPISSVSLSSGSRACDGHGQLELHLANIGI